MKRILLILFFAYFFNSSGEASASASAPDFDSALERISRTLQTSILAAPSFSSQQKESLQLTSSALNLYLDHPENPNLQGYLDLALEQYPKNQLAVFLKAVSFDHAGEPGQANHFYKTFLVHANQNAAFEASYIKWVDYYKLRKGAYDILRRRGVLSKKETQALNPGGSFPDFIRYASNPIHPDRWVTLLFPLFILSGGVLLVLAGLGGFEFNGHFTWNLPNVYFSIWIAYILWLADIAFGLPFGWNRWAAAFSLLAGSFIFLLISGIIGTWREKNLPLEYGYQKCPQCGTVFEGLVIECPQCRQKVL